MPFEIQAQSTWSIYSRHSRPGCSSKAIYLLFFNTRSYRKNIKPPPCGWWENQPDREGMLIQLRRERGLSRVGDYRLPLVALNRLILQSGLTLGIGKLAVYIAVGALFAFGASTLRYTPASCGRLAQLVRAPL